MSGNGILLTLLAGSFFVIGYLITLFIKKADKLINFTNGMAFSVMVILGMVDLSSEAWESFSTYYNNNNFLGLGMTLLSILVGVVIIKLIDIMIPHHNHYEEKKTHYNHLYHIGMITFISLIIHNIIEGMSIYHLGNIDLKSGILVAVGIGLHNLPFGVQIGAIMNDDKNWKKSIFMIFSLFISMTLGGVLMGLIGGINLLVNGTLVGITLGMIIYLIIFELLVEIKESNNKKLSYLGIISGIILMIISMML